MLNNLTTRTNNSTNKFFWNFECFNTWNLWFHLFARFRNGFYYLVENVFASLFSLHKCLFEDFKRKSVALDIHLCRCNTVACTCCLEVHIAQMVLVAKNIAEHGILFFARVLNQPHCNTRYWLLDRHTSVHQSKCSRTYSCHRRRAVRLQYLTYKTHCVREIFWYHTLQTAPSQVSMTNFATTNSTLCLCLARTERREIIMKKESLVTLVEHVVYHLLVQLRTQCTSSECQCFATLEVCASVRHRQWIYFAPYWANFIACTAVHALTCIKNAAAH